MGNELGRYGFLTVWLWLMILANVLVAAGYLFVGFFPSASHAPGIPASFFVVAGFIAVMNVIFAIALFKWRKWGFWGILIDSVIIFILNISVASQPVLPSLLGGLFGISILFWALSMGKERKAWPRLV